MLRTIRLSRHRRELRKIVVLNGCVKLPNRNELARWARRYMCRRHALTTSDLLRSHAPGAFPINQPEPGSQFPELENSRTKTHTPAQCRRGENRVGKREPDANKSSIQLPASHSAFLALLVRLAPSPSVLSLTLAS